MNNVYIGVDVKASHHGLELGAIPAFASRDWEKPQIISVRIIDIWSNLKQEPIEYKSESLLLEPTGSFCVIRPFHPCRCSSPTIVHLISKLYHLLPPPPSMPWPTAFLEKGLTDVFRKCRVLRKGSRDYMSQNNLDVRVKVSNPKDDQREVCRPTSLLTIFLKS
jgi:hypothetical protein